LKNYFELFDIPVSYVIDIDDLSARYRRLQQQVHPDKFVTSSAQDRRLSMQHAARVNDAYTVLKNALKRAQYLLEISESSATKEEAVLDNGFLMEQMELRETLESISSSQNPTQTFAAFIKKIDGLEKNLISTLVTQFANLTANSFGETSQTVKKLQFINKLKEETIELEDELY